MSIQGLIRYQTFIRSELVERIEELEVERGRYREALELIVENYKAMSAWDNKLIIPNLRIANDALEGEK